MRDCDRPRNSSNDHDIGPERLGLTKIAYGTSETLRLLSIGRTSLYQAIKRGDLKCSKLGKKTLFLAVDIAEFLAGLQRQ